MHIRGFPIGVWSSEWYNNTGFEDHILENCFDGQQYLEGQRIKNLNWEVSENTV